MRTNFAVLGVQDNSFAVMRLTLDEIVKILPSVVPVDASIVARIVSEKSESACVDLVGSLRKTVETGLNAVFGKLLDPLKDLKADELVLVRQVIHVCKERQNGGSLD